MKKKTMFFFAILLAFVLNIQIVFADETGKFVTNNGSATWSAYKVGDFVIDVTVDGVTLSNKIAYCCEHDKATPTKSTTVTAKLYTPDTPGYNRSIASVLYYGLGGDNNQIGEGDEAVVAMSMALDRFYAGTIHSSTSIIGRNSKYQILVQHGENQDCPEGTSYILCTPSSSSLQVVGAYAGIVNAKGNLVIEKKDNYGQYKSGATFSVSGDGKNWNVTTGSDGKAYLNDLKVGTYTITETQAPDKMKNEEANRTNTINITAGQTLTYTRTNGYPTGSTRLKKYDADNRGATLGDAKLSGAVYNLCAAEDIYEGTTLRYRNGQVVKEVVTDENGDTPAITGLPVGKYYYIETSPSIGFLLNTERIPVSINYVNQYTYVIQESYVETSEKPIYSNLQIHKRLGETDYDSEIDLSDTQFEVMLKSDNTQVYYTTVTDSEGICTLNNIPYGEYEISECKLNDAGYQVDNFDNLFSENGKTYEFTKVDMSKEMQISVNKVLLPETVGKTDAKVLGAYFTVYTDEAATQPYMDKNGNIVQIGPTDVNGYAISGTMRTGTYYLKETTFPEGINPDAIVPGENITFREKIYKASYDNTKQGQNSVVVSINNIINIPNLGTIDAIKYDNNVDSSEENPSEGAIIALTLKSNKDCVYYATIDKNGFAKFINKDLEGLGYDYTIPYGEYEITEVKESNSSNHTSFYFQSNSVTIKENAQQVHRIYSEEPVEAWIKVIKKDKDSSNTIKLEGAKFKIWDTQNNEWVRLMKTPSGEMIDEFVINDEGYLYTPQQLYPGTYVIYETQAPKGYYLEDSLRVPTNEKDLGNTQVSGKELVVNKVATGIKDNTVYPEGGVKTGELIIEEEIFDTPLKVNLEIHKKGEKITGTTITQVEYPTSETEKQKEDKYTAKYTMEGLEGVGYRIYAVADTYTPDGIKRYDKGQMVADITTNSEGIAIAKNIYPGEYRIDEYKTPKGYLKDENIPNVVLENEDQYVKNATVKKELSDVRQKLQLTFAKTFDEINFANSETPEQKALFGVYTNNDIKNYKGENTVIPEDSLVDLIWTDENNDVTSTIDLPEGTYYVKELYASYPYTKSIETQEFTLNYNGNDKQEFVVKQGDAINNTYDSSSITLVKLASTTVDNVILNGDKIDKTDLDDKVKEIIDAMKGMTEEEIKEYFRKNEVKFVAGAKYRVYTDENCTKELRIKNEETGEFEVAEIVTNENGVIKLENIPLGEYYMKEVEAPNGYELSNEVTKVILDATTKNTMVYQALIEDDVVGSLITKTDIFTGEVIPNCIFEIADENGEVLLHSITNDEGKASIPVTLFENGKTYTYTEIEAPDIYDLNTEPHEFVAEFDEEGNWITEPIEVENIRKKSTVTITKLDMVDSTPIPNCKFELKSLETDFKVEGVTDEEGIYVFENIPYGKYTYTELEAPEEYLIDTTPHEIIIDAEDMKIVVKDERAPETGDIQIYMLLSIALVSMFGVLVVIRRNILIKK